MARKRGQHPSKQGLAKFFEEPCPNCLYISNKFFRVPKGVLKTKIRSWSLQNILLHYYYYYYYYIIIYLFTSIWLLTGGSGYFTCKQNMKLVTTEYKSGGLHEKHVVATWNVGNRLSVCL